LILSIDPDRIVRKYTHTYIDGRVVDNVNQYPDIYYPLFTDWLKNIWIKEKCAKYIFDRMGLISIPHLLKAFPNQVDALPKAYLMNYIEKPKSD
jgi:hypothetical protein